MGKSNGVNKREKSAPAGLSAHTFEAGGDEFVVFSWGARPKARAASLTPAEQEVLVLIASGASNRAIAERRGVSERTIANQVASILRKLGARSRFELMR